MRKYRAPYWKSRVRSAWKRSAFLARTTSAGSLLRRSHGDTDSRTKTRSGERAKDRVLPRDRSRANQYSRESRGRRRGTRVMIWSLRCAQLRSSVSPERRGDRANPRWRRDRCPPANRYTAIKTKISWRGENVKLLPGRGAARRNATVLKMRIHK